MNIAQHFERAVRHFPDKPAIVFEGTSVSYSELQRQADATAHGLGRLGVGVGDRVLLFLPNIPAFAVTFLAIQKVGAIAVSANVMFTTEELEYLIVDSGARVLFTVAALIQSWGPLRDSVRVVVCEGDASGFPTLQEIAVNGTDVKACDMQPQHPAAILYTSGTTGRQKGATLSHGNLVSNTVAAVHTQGITPDDRLMLFLPLFHIFGQNAIMNTAFASAATVVLQRRYDPVESLNVIERERVTMLFAVPTIYIGLLNAGCSPDRLQSIRYYFSAAATMPVEIAERWKTTYHHQIAEGYGLTETSPFATYNPIRQHRPGSVGTPIENVEIKILDPEDQELAAGTWGEICIKGPNVMLGYWNRPEETAQAIRNHWFHSGDIGYMDEDGYIFIVDRMKDMINAAGFKVWPREVEEVLFQHSSVQECAVVGLSDPEKGESPAAYLVLRDGASLTAEECDAYCRQHLAAYKVPRHLEFVESLPKNATGKILKRVLRDQGNQVSARRRRLPPGQVPAQREDSDNDLICRSE